MHSAKSLRDSISVAGGPAPSTICIHGSDVLPTATDRVVLSLMEQNRNGIGCFRGSNEIGPHAWWPVKPTPQISNGLGRPEPASHDVCRSRRKGAIRDLPGAGKALAPRLTVAFGSDRTRYPGAGSFQKHAGLAPVREKSGGQLWTHWRWQAPAFLRQSLVKWAGQMAVRSSWGKRYYERMKAKGKKHHVILRALAFKWTRILWRCWKANTPYDEDRYLKALKTQQPQPATA